MDGVQLSQGYRVTTHLINIEQMKYWVNLEPPSGFEPRTLGFFFNWDSLQAKAEQPLHSMDLQEKEAQEDCGIQEICLERTYS